MILKKQNFRGIYLSSGSYLVGLVTFGYGGGNEAGVSCHKGQVEKCNGGGIDYMSRTVCCPGNIISPDEVGLCTNEVSLPDNQTNNTLEVKPGAPRLHRSGTTQGGWVEL